MLAVLCVMGVASLFMSTWSLLLLMDLMYDWRTKIRLVGMNRKLRKLLTEAAERG